MTKDGLVMVGNGVYPVSRIQWLDTGDGGRGVARWAGGGRAAKVTVAVPDQSHLKTLVLGWVVSLGLWR